MNQERAKQLLPIIQAYADGKTIQYRNDSNHGWVDADRPVWMDGVEYRIKPVPRKTVSYRRFIAEFNGNKYVAIKYPDGHAPCHYVWHGVFVAWIDQDWITSEVPEVE